MNSIDFSKINPFEQQIYERLLAHTKDFPHIKITQAAEICNCSISKISTVAKKLGFSNYKQFMDVVYGREIPVKKTSGELERLTRFIHDFDHTLVDRFVELMDERERILLFGYGPSFICAQYFEYRLRTCSGVFVQVADEISYETMIDQQTLLVIFTTTGTFRSFADIYHTAKEKGCKVLIVAEEYNTELLNNCDQIFWLCKYPQPEGLRPHEKSRTVFFIFMEEILHKLLNASKNEEK